mmetsp:Transcript_12990/g.30542  ORF Transcript_12990/g.30542 Transcript_12990/m.30542 type:complete len:204 (+) Transcript_12990:129-740(+)
MSASCAYGLFCATVASTARASRRSSSATRPFSMMASSGGTPPICTRAMAKSICSTMSISSPIRPTNRSVASSSIAVPSRHGLVPSCSASRISPARFTRSTTPSFMTASRNSFFSLLIGAGGSELVPSPSAVCAMLHLRSAAHAAGSTPSGAEAMVDGQWSMVGGFRFALVVLCFFRSRPSLWPSSSRLSPANGDRWRWRPGEH